MVIIVIVRVLVVWVSRKDDPGSVDVDVAIEV